MGTEDFYHTMLGIDVNFMVRDVSTFQDVYPCSQPHLRHTIHTDCGVNCNEDHVHLTEGRLFALRTKSREATGFEDDEDVVCWEKNPEHFSTCRGLHVTEEMQKEWYDQCATVPLCKVMLEKGWCRYDCKYRHWTRKE